MKLKTYLGMALLVLTSFGLFAADKPKKEMSAEEKAQMDAMMKAGAPGEEHKKLAGMVGTWNATVKMWNAPGTEPQVSKGVSVNTKVLGGRWIQEKFTGSFMGMPFSGMGYTGYDNMSKQYVGTWMDTMSTGMMSSTGKAEGDNTFTFDSTMPDPMTGKNVPTKMKMTVVDKNKHIMEMWAPAPDGTQFKMMEITYIRKKS